MALPETHQALVIRDVDIEPKVETVPVPECLPGTVILKVVASPVISYTKDVFLGNSRKYTFPLPIVPGTSCICRVAALPADAASAELSAGSLVWVDSVIRSRTNDATGASVYIFGLHDGHSITSKALMAKGGCKDGSYAQYMRVPVENVFMLNEEILLRSSTSFPSSRNLGYEVSNLCSISRLLVPYGGIRSINLLPGESILIGPATGSFGSAAVILALSLGAKVVAWGRTQGKIDRLNALVATIQGGRYAPLFESVVLIDDPTKDVDTIIRANSNRRLDAVFDITPPLASGTSYIKSAILCLRNAGRVSLMGGIREDISIPHGFVMHQDITIKGKWMYDQHDTMSFLQLVETGIVKLDEKGSGSKIIGSFPLTDWKAAWNLAYDHDGPGETVVILPGNGN